jgi:UDP-GlcNAc:undecaprenyl-phosphate GlcNAc-1-phosphate transferase
MFYGFLLALAGQTEFIALPIILVCVLIPYLLFNLGLVPGPVKKIFMGDAGSMFIGLTVIWLLTLGSQTEEPAFRTVTALWIIAIPLMDMAAIIIRRVRKGQSAFQADRDHLHHIFMRAGFSSRESLVVIVIFSLISSSIGILGEYFNVHEAIMFYGFLLAFAGYSYGIKHCWRLVRWVKQSRLA